MDKVCSSLIVFDYVTKSKMKVFLYVAEKWGWFLVDRVRAPILIFRTRFCVCDVQAFLCPGHGYIEQSCGFSDFFRGLLVKEWIDTIGCREDDHTLKLQAFCLVDCRDEHLFTDT